MIRKTCLTLALLFFLAILFLDMLFATGLLKGFFIVGLHLILGGIKYAVTSFPYVFGSVSHPLWTLAILLGAFLGVHGLMMMLGKKGVRRKLPQSARVFALALLLLGGASAASQAARNAFRLASQDAFLEPDRGYVGISIRNARQLLVALRIYALDHEGKYPDHLEELVSAGVMDPGPLAKHNKVHKPGDIPVPWTFLRGLREDAPGNLPVFVSPTSYASGRYIIGYNDSSASMEEAAEYEAAIQRWREYRKLHPIIGPAKVKGGDDP